MVKKTTVLLLAASLVLTACGQKEAAPEQPSPPKQQTGTEKPPEKSDPPAAPGQPGSDAGEDKQKEPDGKPGGENGGKDNPGDKQSGNSTPEAPARPQYHMNKVYNIVPNDNAEKKVVLLTFDDGPKEKKMIDELIDTLDKHNAKAIFFVNGYRVKQNPDLLKLIHERGQIIGNHSWDHIDLRKQTAKEARRQIEDVQKIVEELTGEKPKFFRPPFGSGGDTVKQITKENGLLFMTWSNGSLDWESKTRNKPDAVIKNVMDQLHPGSNILMHELPWTVEALDTLLTKMEKEGYGFVDPRNIEPEMR